MTTDSPDLQAAIRGERPARQALVTAYGPRVYALCRRLDPSPDDAYQSAWEKVFAGLASFDPHRGPPLIAWITTVTRRHLIDRHRRRRARGEVVPLEDVPVPPSTKDPFAEARLERALAHLSDAQRQVVVQHHLHDVDLPTLSAELEIPVGTLKSRLHRARARLAQLLGEP